MSNVSIDLLYNEIRQVHKELHEIRSVLIPNVPEEETSEAELKEIDSIVAEMKQGKATPWRDVLKK